MKRTQSNIVIETGGAGTEESFGIGNLGFILKILRGKMYANPIKAICREISSNSRDAHREVGKDDLPIEIHIPNVFDSHIKFKDYGPGIDPGRMSGVFILYGNTTKDSDNVQTGGFGLGAKTPFAYSDQFSIITVTPEKRDDKTVHIKRNYIAYIDPSEAGKMRKVSETETDEPCGTELSIYVDENDWETFTEAVMEVTAHWKVKPVLGGREPLPQYKEDSSNPFLEGTGWSMPKFEQKSYYDRDQSLAIVDGIAYPIDSNDMNLGDSENTLLRHGLRFHFGVGELSLSSNRERLQYDDTTVSLIKDKLAEVIKEVLNLLQEKIQAQTSLRAAACFFAEFKETLGCAVSDNFQPLWCGYSCKKTDIKLNIDMRKANDWFYHDNKDCKKGIFLDNYKLEHSRRSYNKVLKREPNRSVTLSQKTVLYVNDLSTERVSRTRVYQICKEAQDNGIELDVVQVLTFSDGDVAGGLNECKDANKDKIDLRLLDVKMLSSVVLPEKEKRAKKQRNGRGKSRGCFAAFVLDNVYEDSRRSCDRYWRPTEIEKKSTNAGVYVVVESHKKTIYSDDLKLDTNQTLEIKKFIGDDVTIYGVHSRDLQYLGPNWEKLKDVLKRELDVKMKGVSLATVRDIINGSQHRMSECMGTTMFRFISQNINMINDNNSTLKQYFEMSEKQYTDAKNYQQLWNISSFVYPNIHSQKFNPNTTLEDLKDKFTKRYPLISFFTYNIPTKEAFFEYINLIDDKYNSENKTVDNDVAYVKMAATV